MIFLFLIFFDLKGASAVYLLENEVIKIDGKKQIYRYKKHMKILTKRGREKYGNDYFRYHKEEDFKILQVYTCVDGKKKHPVKGAIGDLSASETFKAPQYANLMAKTIAYPDVNPGSEIFIEFEKEKKIKGKLMLYDKVQMKKSEPIVHKELKIILPKKQYFKYKIEGDIIKFEEKDSGKFKIYRFWVDSVDRYIAEPFSPPSADITPNVQYTTFKTWKEVADYLRKEFNKSQKGMKKLKKYLTTDSLYLIYEWVTKEWRDIPIALSFAGFKPTRCSKIYVNKYGDIKDKCALLIAFLKLCGIKAYPAYFSKFEIDTEIPMPLFTDMLVAVPQKAGYLLLDPKLPLPEIQEGGIFGILKGFNENFVLRSKFAGRKLFIVKDKGFEFYRVPLPDFDNSYTKVFMKGEIDKNFNLEGEFMCEVRGSLSRLYRRIFMRKSKEEIDKLMQGYTNNIKQGAKLISYEIKGVEDLNSAVEISLKFIAPDYLRHSYLNRYNFGLPANILGTGREAMYLSIKERHYPLVIDIPFLSKYKVCVKLPENIKIVYLPQKYEYEDDLIYCKILYEEKNDSLICEREFGFKKKEYSLPEYEKILAIYKEFASPKRYFVIFEKK